MQICTILLSQKIYPIFRVIDNLPAIYKIESNSGVSPHVGFPLGAKAPHQSKKGVVLNKSRHLF